MVAIDLIVDQIENLQQSVHCEYNYIGTDTEECGLCTH